jgi:hypothetical protein
MMLRRAVSYLLGFSVGLLAIAPPMNYSIPVVINSYAWLYGFMVAAFLALFLMSSSLPLSIKALTIYLLATCFVSMAPYLSFNAFILVVVSLYGFLWLTKCDFDVVIDLITAAFFVQVMVTIAQLFGMDKLMNFDRPEPVFFGTIMQYMRFSSLLAVMAPFLVFKNKKFIFLIAVLAIASQSSSFGLAVIAGTVTYFWLTKKNIRKYVVIFGALATAGFLLWDHGSVTTAFTCGRVQVWQDIVRTWVMNTSHNFVLPLTGPVDWKSIIVGRGMDTFMPLFPIFKHDMNPFAQAHCDWLQFLWEIGVVGTGILMVYLVNLTRRLREHPILIAGGVCMAVNMFFAFPVRMTQTSFLLIAFLALCEQKARGEQYA